MLRQIEELADESIILSPKRRDMTYPKARVDKVGARDLDEEEEAKI